MVDRRRCRADRIIASCGVRELRISIDAMAVISQCPPLRPCQGATRRIGDVPIRRPDQVIIDVCSRQRCIHNENAIATGCGLDDIVLDLDIRRVVNIHRPSAADNGIIPDISSSGLSRR